MCCFVFAFMAHHGVPGLVQLMEKKESAKTVFTGAMTLSASVYLALGIVCALYVREYCQR